MPALGSCNTGTLIDVYTHAQVVLRACYSGSQIPALALHGAKALTPPPTPPTHHGVLRGAQVALYLLLMEDRYQQPCDLGLLWNSNDGPAAMQAVRRVPAELAALMMHRNRLASYLAAPVRCPPPMLQREHQCSRCHAKTACTTYHKVGA